MLHSSESVNGKSSCGGTGEVERDISRWTERDLPTSYDGGVPVSSVTRFFVAEEPENQISQRYNAGSQDRGGIKG